MSNLSDLKTVGVESLFKQGPVIDRSKARPLNSGDVCQQIRDLEYFGGADAHAILCALGARIQQNAAILQGAPRDKAYDALMVVDNAADAIAEVYSLAGYRSAVEEA